MFNQQNQYAQAGTAFTQSVTFDAGLRAHMMRIFNLVAGGLAVSGLAAYAIFTIPALQPIFLNRMVNMVIGIGLLAFLWIGMRPNKMMQQSVGSAYAKYFIFSALLGTTLSYIFLLYAQTTVLRVFFITASMFAGMSLVGYTTKRDLTGMGSFLLMGLVGLIIASLVNIFMHSSGLQFGISIIGVLIFTGLIAFDAQQAKRLYSPNNSPDTNQKLAVFSALGLYINFINLFQMLLSIMGNRN